MSIYIDPVPMITGTGRYDFTFEDRTGRNDDTDWDDIYERLYFRVRRTPDSAGTLTPESPSATPPASTTINIYNVAYRMMRRDSSHLQIKPSVVLEFTPTNGLGEIRYDTELYQGSFPMGRYLKKISFFGRSSLVRKFSGSDGNEYRWSWRSVEGQEWTVRL